MIKTLAEVLSIYGKNTLQTRRNQGGGVWSIYGKPREKSHDLRCHPVASVDRPTPLGGRNRQLYNSSCETLPKTSYQCQIRKNQTAKNAKVAKRICDFSWLLGELGVFGGSNC